MSDDVASGDAFEYRVAREHEQLEPLFERARDSLAAGTSSAAFAAMSKLRMALEAHTAQEDRLYYPALWSLCPQHKADLEHFIHSHDRFRGELDEIFRSISGGDLSGAAELFEAFSKSFATHEVYEEELLRKIDAESPRSD